MWSGAIYSVPSGWLLYNDLNGTPDLKDRFIIGADNSCGVDITGGETSHVLNVAETPSHNHTASTSVSLSGVQATSAGNHSHEVNNLLNNKVNVSDFNSLKTSVSNGKSAVASAITDKGVSTSATASFDTMANNSGVLKQTTITII